MNGSGLSESLYSTGQQVYKDILPTAMEIIDDIATSLEDAHKTTLR